MHIRIEIIEMDMDNSKKWKQGGLLREDGFISFLFGWALVTVVFLVVLLFQILSFSSPSEIKQLKGQGTVRTYDFPYDRVFYTSVRLINERGLAIIESNKGDGYIIASDSSDFFYNGRVFALFFTSGSLKDSTQVEVLSRFMALPSLRELFLPRNSPSRLLDDICRYLENDKVVY